MSDIEIIVINYSFFMTNSCNLDIFFIFYRKKYFFFQQLNIFFFIEKFEKRKGN